MRAPGFVARRPALVRHLVGYGLIGVLNSTVGWAVVFGLDLGGIARPAVANAFGFVVGMAVSFTLHRRLFEAARTRAETARYGAAVASAFALNQLVLALALHALGRSEGARAASQALALIAYSASFFVLCRTVVFRPASAAPRDKGEVVQGDAERG